MHKNSYLIAYFLIIAVCFFSYIQLDIGHTTYSSYAFLDGHILDFYDFNKKTLGGNDYLPSIYIIFAIWNIPIYLLGLATTPEYRPFIEYISPFEIFWSKLLIGLLFLATIKVISHISKIIDDGKSNLLKNDAGLLLATAPIAIFAVFIFSQYDITGLLFSIIGIYYLFRKDNIKFALFFSFAISFKYFALVIFIPLLLLSEKRIIRIIGYTLIALSVTIFELAFYWRSEIFRGEIFTLMSHKLGDAYGGHSSLITWPLILMITYGAMCAYLFFKRVKEGQEFYRLAIFSCIAAYACMFDSVLWHPQWLILLMPFFALAYRYLPRPKYMAYLDILGMISYTWICLIYWPNNVDVSMVNFGILKQFFPKVSLIGSDFIFPALNGFFIRFFHIYVFSPILVYFYQNIIKNKTIYDDLTLRVLFSRVFIGIGIFLTLTLLSLYLPTSIANSINPDAYLRRYSIDNINKSTGKTVNEILDGHTVTQHFKAKSNGLAAVGIQMANYQRKPSGFLILTLKNMNGDVVASNKIEASKIQDNQMYRFKFSSLVDSESHSYVLLIQSIGAVSGSAVTAWVDESDEAVDIGGLELDGKRQKGGLVMQLYYDPSAK